MEKIVSNKNNLQILYEDNHIIAINKRCGDIVQGDKTGDKLNSADAMIFQTEKQLKEFGDKLSDDKKKPIEEALEELKKSFESKDLEKIDPALEKINEAWKAASEEMYKAQQNQQGQAQQPADEQSADNSDNVEDVDFEEVKE